MKLYNTLTRLKEDFTPGKPPQATIYTCGPTVYNFAHIGNFRTYIFEDVLKRVLEAQGFNPRHVMNVTDVGHLVSDDDAGEDKMELGSQREGKTAWELARFYEKAFFDGFSSLNCRMPDIVCRATEHIPEMIALVRKLEADGFTYKTGDGIYFDTSKFPHYYRLAGKSHIEGLKAGARVQFSEEKRSAADFALWKFSPQDKKRQMEWPSPWGTGFPGWHIECSAMAMKYLGDTLDIHCGGVDHVAIHHTNEIAQSEAATGKPFARFWVHGEFLVTKDAAKMAKSSGEFLTLEVLVKKGFEPLDYRYLCLGAHYRTQLVFSWEAMEFARTSLAKLREAARAASAVCEGAADAKGAEKHMAEFDSAVADDMNMPRALAAVWEGLRDAALSPAAKLALAKNADAVLGL
ncbi:MAG: cysteine--tRNA ligase, partial [Elusimicrobia bacterium]|nr:cysteine--tRNA ligase [Elusimicrobiota bacterium]